MRNFHAIFLRSNSVPHDGPREAAGPRREGEAAKTHTRAVTGRLPRPRPPAACLPHWRGRHPLPSSPSTHPAPGTGPRRAALHVQEHAAPPHQEHEHHADERDDHPAGDVHLRFVVGTVILRESAPRAHGNPAQAARGPGSARWRLERRAFSSLTRLYGGCAIGTVRFIAAGGW